MRRRALLAASGGGGDNLITFYLSDSYETFEYKAPQGMTWAEFIVSDYANKHSDIFHSWSTQSYGAYNGIMVYYEYNAGLGSIYYDTFFRNTVRSTDEIENEYIYYLH